MIRTIN